MKKPSIHSQIQNAVGTQKIDIIARELDRIHAELTESANNEDIDGIIETLSLNEIAEQQGVPVRYLRDQISRTLGSPSVVKMGRTWIIRKTTWLRYLKACETSN